MRKMNNKGFSMVEILISIAIFAVLMIPIVGAIISSLKNTTKAKTLQYRNEFVENVVEYVKQDSLDNIFAGDYFTTIGSYTGSAGKPIKLDATFYTKSTDTTYDSELQEIADSLYKYGGLDMSIPKNQTGSRLDDTDVVEAARGGKEFPYEEYVLSGKVDLGAKDTTYAYKMLISNKYYANKELEAKKVGETYVNPNNLALGIVEDIDYTKVALFNGTLANYDTTVYNAFYTKKVEILKEKNSEKYAQFVGQKDKGDFFSFDSCKRIITVKVEGSETSGYTVSCKLTYHDDGASHTFIRDALTGYNIVYEPFVFDYPVDPTTKKANLPNIYLMYNVSKYGNDYSSDDYIEFDTSGVTDGTDVKCFIVETAESYSKNITDANSTLTEGKKLHSDYSFTGMKRNDVVIHMAATAGSDLSKLHIYHNFAIGGNARDAKNLKNTLIKYKDDDPFDTFFKKEGRLALQSSSGNVADFAALNEAKEESRGLYEIKVWMVEGDDPSVIDINTDTPIMTATKGGDES